MTDQDVTPYIQAIDFIGEKLAESAPQGNDPGSIAVRDASRNLRGLVSKLSSRAHALKQLAETRDPTRTPEAHEKRVAQAAKELERDIERVTDQANEHHRRAHLQIEEMLEKKVNLVPNEYASEFRAIFRGMETQERLSLIQELVDNNDGPQLAAILKAPKVLTGLTGEQQAQFQQMLYNRHAGEEVKARDTLHNTFSSTLSAVQQARRTSMALTDSQKLARIEAGERAANEAETRFKESKFEAASGE